LYILLCIYNNSPTEFAVYCRNLPAVLLIIHIQLLWRLLLSVLLASLQVEVLMNR